jgi:hypothetical protein
MVTDDWFLTYFFAEQISTEISKREKKERAKIKEILLWVKYSEMISNELTLITCSRKWFLLFMVLGKLTCISFFYFIFFISTVYELHTNAVLT